MQITPVNYNYTNQKVQKNNQQSFGMAATKAMENFWSANRIRLLTSLPPYNSEQIIDIIQGWDKISTHPSTIVDFKDASIIISKKGEPNKIIPVEGLEAIEEAAKEL